MNPLVFRLLLLCGLALSGLVSASAASPSKFAVQPTKPASAPLKDDPQLPRVLLIGDSISIDYTTPVRQRLAGQANVYRIPANGGPTTNGLAQLDTWLGTQKWDVIHFNWGLHDLKIMAEGKRMVPIQEYEKNLAALAHRLQQTGAKLIWATTTPVPAGKLNPPRDPSDVTIYNTAAKRVMEKHGVAINDLYAFALPQLAALQTRANVHFKPDGSAALAERVAASILTALNGRISK